MNNNEEMSAEDEIRKIVKEAVARDRQRIDQTDQSLAVLRNRTTLSPDEVHKAITFLATSGRWETKIYPKGRRGRTSLSTIVKTAISLRSLGADKRPKFSWRDLIPSLIHCVGRGIGTQRH